MQFLNLRSGSSGPLFEGENDQDAVLWSAAAQKFYVGPVPGGGGGVTSFNARTGAVVPVSGDYDSDQIDNESGVAGASVSDALDALQAEIAAVTLDPLTRTFYVDSGSGAATEDGSIASPFKTLGAGLTALGAAGGVLLVVAADYSGEPSRAVDLTGAVSITNTAGLQGLPISANLIGLPALTTTGAGALNLTGCTTGTIAMVAGTLQLSSSVLGDDLTGCTLFAAEDSAILGEFTAATADFFHCFFGSSGNLGTSSLSIDFEMCSFNSGPPMTVTFAPGAGALHVDSFSDFGFASVPGTVINGVIVREYPQRAFGIVQVSDAAESNKFPTDAVLETTVAMLGSAFYYEGSSVFTLGANCTLTYTGPDADFLLEVCGSFTRVGVALEAPFALAIAKNGDLLGVPMFDVAMYRAGAAYPKSVIDVVMVEVPSTRRRVSLTSGDTLQPVGARSGNAFDIFAVTMTFTAEQI